MNEIFHERNSTNGEAASKHRSVSSDRHRMRNRMSQSQSTPNFRKFDSAHKSNPTLVKGDFMPKQLQTLESRSNFRQQRSSKMSYYPSNSRISPTLHNADEKEFSRIGQTAENENLDESQKSRGMTLHNIRDLLLNKTRERLFQSNKPNPYSNSSTNFYQDKLSRYYRNSSSPKQHSSNLSVFRSHTVTSPETQRHSPNLFPNKENDVIGSVERDENEPYNGSPYRRPGGFGSMPKSRSFHSMKTAKADEYFFTLAAQMSVARETDL